MELPLFDSSMQHIQLTDAQLIWCPNFIETNQANHFFKLLTQQLPWQSDDITVFGKTYPQPRLTCLFGLDDKPYKYSNITMHPHKFTPLVMALKERVEEVSETFFNAVLCNLYRTGQDSNGWHADNESALGQNPIIASLSFGAARTFAMKHNTTNESYKISLTNGSLLVMKGPMQHHWKHAIPKTKQKIEPRINLTFRTLK